MKLIILLISLFYTSTISAQPVYNSISLPVIGSSISTKTKAVSLDEGASGENQIWDFSGFDTTGSIKSISHIQSPVTTGKSFLEPASNFAEVSYGNINFSLISTEKIELLGRYIAATDLYSDYSDPVVTLRAPMAFGDFFSDDFSSTFSYQGVNINNTGIINMEYDGYGTLITPLGTYNNVIRFHSSRTDYDSYEWITQTTVSNSYTWYLPGNPYPFFAITHTATSNPLGGTIDTDFVMLYELNEVTGNKKASSGHINFTVSPNPASDYITINFSETGTHDISFINEYGRVVYNEISSIQTRINISELPSGMYLIKVGSENSISTRKILIK